MMKLEDKLKNQIKHDWFSDAVTSGLNSVGITQDIRNQAQPLVDQAASYAKTNLLPKGGAVIPPAPAIGAKPQATGFKFPSNVSPVLIAVVAVVAVLIILEVK